jgi:CDP-glycerol:poly(glycerophosphate) glycerophosphotransferase
VKGGGHCVLVSVPHGAAAGNMLRTGSLARLLEHDPDLRLVILSPMANDPAFLREVAHQRVTVEDLPAHRPAGLEARLLTLMQASYLDSAITESVRIRRIEARANGTIRWIRAKHLIARLIAPSMTAPPTRYAVSDRMVAHPGAEALFEKHQPVMLVTSNPGLILAEVPLLRTAVRRRVWSVAIDPSWDNFTNKLLPIRQVNRLIVWNDLMKAQAVEFHGYEASAIRVVGTPQWDRYFRDGVTISREAYCQRIGADPNRALITLTTTPRPLYPHHDHVLRVLVHAIRSGRFPRAAQILVRLHPRDERTHYAEFESVPEVMLEKPFRETVRAGDGLAVDVTADSQQHLADTLRHSDVIVNVASTIAIEAAIFDTPIVNIAFDGEQDSPFAQSARRYYRFTHYVNITRHGAARVASTPDELVAAIGRYLADRSLDAEARRRVALEQCQFLDGRAAERVSEALLADLAEVTGRTEEERRSCA